jgi:hypothetical protein
MNKFTKFVRTFRAGAGEDRTMRSFYGAVAQRVDSGAPTYEESRRDFREMRRATERTSMF